MTRVVVRVRDKDINDLRRAALRAAMTVEAYVEDVVEVWLARARSARKEELVVRGHLSSSLTAHAVLRLRR